MAHPFQTPPYSARKLDFFIGGLPVVELSAPKPSDPGTPAVTGAFILPGRGMNVYQLKAWHPGHGDFDMFHAMPLHEAEEFFDNSPDDFMGNRSFMVGGAVLIPYGNRIRGRLCADGKSLETKVLGRTVILPANWSSKGNTQGEKVAMHGLILARAMHEVSLTADGTSSAVTGVLRAGDFDSRWAGWSRITTACTLSCGGFSLHVTIENKGTETLPIGVGRHPFFRFLSGKRAIILGYSRKS